jgi:very-short-patch-repair endonuclease
MFYFHHLTSQIQNIHLLYTLDMYFQVIPQVKVGNYRLDMVVEGHNDARLAIECDGNRYHDA